MFRLNDALISDSVTLRLPEYPGAWRKTLQIVPGKSAAELSCAGQQAAKTDKDGSVPAGRQDDNRKNPLFIQLKTAAPPSEPEQSLAPVRKRQPFIAVLKKDRTADQHALREFHGPPQVDPVRLSAWSEPFFLETGTHLDEAGCLQGRRDPATS